jgi:hypothetical protein
VLLERGRQPLTVGHPSRSLDAGSHQTDTWRAADVTRSFIRPAEP